jgi:hypothetical protein
MKLAQRTCVFVIAVMLTATNTALGETWLCDLTVLEGKPAAKIKWVITGDQMRAFNAARPTTGAVDAYRVVRNDDRVLVAFFKKWKPHRDDSFTSYYVLDKTSGTLVELNDSVMNAIGMGVGSEFAVPNVEVGHCVQAER